MTTSPLAPRSPGLIFGCMKHATEWRIETAGAPAAAADYQRSRTAVETALSLGLTTFDHADIYCQGRSEEMFPRILRDLGVARETLVLQSKCGMIYADGSPQALGKQYDLTYAHILTSVEGTLRRLQTPYLDVLLLHRPDLLAEPEEIAQAFDRLYDSGAVRQFGVSNHMAPRIELLQRHVRQPLVANQLALSLLETTLLDAGLGGSNMNPAAAFNAGGTLDYCRIHGLKVQAWSPLAGGRLGRANPPAGADERFVRTHQALTQLAAEVGSDVETVALAWLLRHPARIQPVIGTRDPARIRACAAARTLELSREQWYRLYNASRGRLLH